jgi:hypothetical protein
VYLHDFDQYIAEHWEHHPNQNHYANKKSAYLNMRRQGYPRYYLIRYADDWVILTDRMEHAQKIKELAKQFLERNGQLELSVEKTLITDVRTSYLTFLGAETRGRPSRKGKGLVTRLSTIKESPWWRNPLSKKAGSTNQAGLPQRQNHSRDVALQLDCSGYRELLEHDFSSQPMRIQCRSQALVQTG